MTQWQLRQLQQRRKEERRAQLINMMGAVAFALVIGGIMFFAR